MDRTWVRRSTKPTCNITLVAPHLDDSYTGEMVKRIARDIDCNAVVNDGFKRAAHVDTAKDEANCNSITHCKDPVVHDEFCKPILQMTGLTRSSFLPKPKYVFMIHGMNHSKHDIVFGYGKGDKNDRLTIPEQDMQKITQHFVIGTGYVNTSYKIALGKGGGLYSARSADNMSQLFRTEFYAPHVNTLQMEFSLKVRQDWRNQSIKIAAAILCGVSCIEKGEKVAIDFSKVDWI